MLAGIVCREWRGILDNLSAGRAAGCDQRGNGGVPSGQHADGIAWLNRDILNMSG